MSLTITLPQARIALGWAVVQGQRIPVEIDMEWMLAFTRLVDRAGGTSGDTNFSEYINQFYDAPPLDPGVRDALRGVDELRNDQGGVQDPQIHELVRMVDELRVELAGIRGMRDMRSRLDDLEATLCGLPSAPAAYVSSVNGKRDNAVLAVADIAGAAPLANAVFTGVTTSPKFQTATGSAAAANGVATTVYALPNAAVAMYLASVNIGSVADAVNWGAFALIATDGASARIVFSNNTGVQTITLSGLNIQTTQGSGGTQTANVTVTKIG
jgi:hypothetical protein